VYVTVGVLVLVGVAVGVGVGNGFIAAGRWTGQPDGNAISWTLVLREYNRSGYYVVWVFGGGNPRDARLAMRLAATPLGVEIIVDFHDDVSAVAQHGTYPRHPAGQYNIVRLPTSSGSILISPRPTLTDP
jgi:hypothetical protein